MLISKPISVCRKYALIILNYVKKNINFSDNFLMKRTSEIWKKNYKIT